MRNAFVRPASITSLLAVALAFTFSLIHTRSGAAGENAGVPWRSSFESAWAEAQSRNRPLWVQFTGPWCLYCRKLDREVLADPLVASIGKTELVPVKVRSDEREDIVSRYDVRALPATVLIAPDGRVIARQTGFVELGGFLQLIEPARRIAAENELALDGNCPVTFVRNGELHKGQRELAARFDDKVYRFADAASRDAFISDPERYVPANAGRCVVHKSRDESIAGDPQFGVYYKERLYLLADADARAEFARDPERFSRLELAEEGNCPHCLRPDGRTVEGKSRYSVTLQGKRYLFPDETHRAAFRAAPDRYLR